MFLKSKINLFGVLLCFCLILMHNYLGAQTSRDKTKKVKNTNIKIMDNQLNVLGTKLELASKNPLTGYYRNGYCTTDANDKGSHVVAAIVTDDFLNFSKSRGNDLITPNANYNFPGLKPGDVWCLCALRWLEAFNANVAPPVILEATHKKTLEYISLDILKKHQHKEN